MQADLELHTPAGRVLRVEMAAVQVYAPAQISYLPTHIKVIRTTANANASYRN
jgi:hypothetical protein